jgi:hypothetical protein
MAKIICLYFSVPMVECPGCYICKWAYHLSDDPQIPRAAIGTWLPPSR